MERKTWVRRRLGLGALFLACLLLSLLASACNGTPPPPSTPPKPTEAVVVQLSDFQVKDDLAKAWATLSVMDAFDLLTTGNFQDPTITNWQVTTDHSGQAQLCPDAHINTSTQTCADVACRIYVYEDTVFGAYPCQKSAAGTTGCSLMGTQAVANCHMTINTISASATGLGTWYSLIYLWDSQMTIVVAGEGTIEVTPIVTLEFEGDVPPLAQMEPLERALAARRLEIRERVPGESEEVEIEDGKAQFLYTAPDAKLEELGLDPDLPERAWHPTDQLPVLVEQLRIVEPRLVPWLERIWERARLDDIDLGPRESIVPGDQLAVITYGEAWQDPRLQESILYAVDWFLLTEEFLGEPLRVQVARQEPTGSLARTGPDAREVGYDPEQAKALLEEAGYGDGTAMVLLVPAEDEPLIEAAKLVVEQMAAIGVNAEVKVLPESEFVDLGRLLGPTGIPAVTLSRR